MGRLDCLDCERASIDNHDFRCTRGVNCVEQKIHKASSMRNKPRPQGRPPKPDDEQRVHLMQIRWTKDEYAWITEERFRRQLENRADLIRVLVDEARVNSSNKEAAE